VWHLISDKRRQRILELYISRLKQLDLWVREHELWDLELSISHQAASDSENNRKFNFQGLRRSWCCYNVVCIVHDTPCHLTTHVSDNQLRVTDNKDSVYSDWWVMSGPGLRKSDVRICSCKTAALPTCLISPFLLTSISLLVIFQIWYIFTQS